MKHFVLLSEKRPEKSGVYDVITSTGFQYTSNYDETLDLWEIDDLDAVGNVIMLWSIPTDQISDGYHTFEELYEFRKMYNAALFNEWGKEIEFVSAGEGVRGIISIPKQPVKYNVHKSWRHHDGELCFGGGWFIVVAMLPTGQITNHYKAEDWDLFKIPEKEKALYPFDGHTGKDVIERLKNL